MKSVMLRVAGTDVAEYQVSPRLDPTLSPRPYLHPVLTLGGVTVTDVLPEDHRWHLGVSLAVQDVSGTNLWGGRTYVRGAGYTWRDDHGRIVSDDITATAPDQLAQRLRWCDPAAGTLLTERRLIAARAVTDAWALEFRYTMTAPADRDVTLGSPATNGRPGGAGYGGLFWRAAPAVEPPAVFTAADEGEEAGNGSTASWLALSRADDHPYTLVFTGLSDGDHWFVRAAQYPGVCAAFAFHTPRVIAAGTSWTGRQVVLVADGARDRAEAAALAAAARALPATPESPVA